MLPIREEDRAFLKFSLNDQTCQFRCLLFGLACPPWVFTKTLKPVAAQLRQQLRSVNCCLHRQPLNPGRVQGTGQGPRDRLGVPPGESRLCSEQCQVSIRADTGHRVSQLHGKLTQQELSIPAGKIKKIGAETHSLLESRTVQIRKLSQLFGKLQAAT